MTDFGLSKRRNLFSECDFFSIKMPNRTWHSRLDAKFGWETMENLPYVLELAPSEFHKFTVLSEQLSGNYFNCAEDVKRAIITWLTQRNTGFMRSGQTNKLVNRCGELVNRQRD
jgi:hypothetical protein